MRYLVIFVLLLFVGCAEIKGVPEMPTTKDVNATTKDVNASRLEVVDHKYSDTWHWKIIRDSKTEKEWFVIHDNGRMIVMPLDGSMPISVGD